MPNQSAETSAFVVTVMIEDRYWSVNMLIDLVATPEAAVKAAQDQFDEAVKLGYITGAFQATQATPIKEWLG